MWPRLIVFRAGKEVPYENIVKGYEVGKGQYIEVKDEELEAISIESTRTIDISSKDRLCQLGND